VELPLAVAPATRWPGPVASAPRWPWQLVRGTLRGVRSEPRKKGARPPRPLANGKPRPQVLQELNSRGQRGPRLVTKRHLLEVGCRPFGQPRQLLLVCGRDSQLWGADDLHPVHVFAGRHCTERRPACLSLSNSNPPRPLVRPRMRSDFLGRERAGIGASGEACKEPEAAANLPTPPPPGDWEVAPCVAGYADRTSIGRRGRGGTGRADNRCGARADMPVGEGPIVERVKGAGGFPRRSGPDLSRRRRGAVGAGGDVAADRHAAAATAAAKFSGTQLQNVKKPIERKGMQKEGIAARTIITRGDVSDDMRLRILPYEGRSAVRQREREPAHPHHPAHM